MGIVRAHAQYHLSLGSLCWGGNSRSACDYSNFLWILFQLLWLLGSGHQYLLRDAHIEVRGRKSWAHMCPRGFQLVLVLPTYRHPPFFHRDFMVQHETQRQQLYRDSLLSFHIMQGQISTTNLTYIQINIDTHVCIYNICVFIHHLSDSAFPIDPWLRQHFYKLSLPIHEHGIDF